MTLPIPVTIEIKAGNDWLDITDDWRKSQPIRIEYGQRDEGGKTDPTVFSFQVNNRNGRYSPRNPNSDLFGLIGRNTPVRASIGTTSPVAFPSIVASGTPHTSTVNSTTKTIEVPAHSAGDRLVLIMIWDDIPGVVSIDDVDGDEWVRVLAEATSDSEARLFVYEIQERQTSGSAQNITVTLQSSQIGTARVYAWQDHDPDTPIEASAPVRAKTTQPDPRSLTPSWGAQNTAWMALVGIDANFLSIAEFPEGYINGEQHVANDAAGTRFGVAFKENNVFTEDPGPFELSGSTWHTVALTLAVRPSTTGQPIPRIVSEVTAWPPRWDQSGNDRWVPIQAAGILRRLAQGTEGIGSVYRRHLTSLPGNQAPIAYWPGEDEGEEIGRLASVVDGVDGMKVFLPFPDFASNNDFAGSQPILTMREGQLIGEIPSVPTGSTGVIQLRFLIRIPSAGAGTNVLIGRLRTSGSLFSWQLIQAASNDFTLRVFNPQGDLADEETNIVFSGMAISGESIYMHLTTEVNGANVDWTWGAINTRTGEHRKAGGSFAGTAARATDVIIGGGANALDNVAIGHISVHAQDVPFDIPGGPGGFTGVSVVTAFRNEPAGRRIRRLCGEEGVALKEIGDLDATELMGPQTPDTFLNLMNEAAQADLGFLFENRETIGLVYRTRESLYNNPPTLTLDRPSGELAEALEPLPDDLGIRNDIRLRRTRGGSRRIVRESGPLSVQPPPDGVGRYEDPITINVVDTERLRDQGGWRLHLGTVDEDRFPGIPINLAHSPIRDNAALEAAILSADLGDVLAITNPPLGLPPDDISQLIQGYRETIDFNTHAITFHTTPGRPWQIAVRDTDHRDTAGSETTAAFESGTDTSMSVATLVGPLWTTDVADFPFDIFVSGVRLEVTAISGTTSPQTFTITQTPVNGVIKTIPVGESVRLFKPARRAL